MRECKRQGCRVLLGTRIAAQANWPRESIDEIFYMPNLSRPNILNRDNIIKGISYLARTQSIDQHSSVDDYDVETAAVLREHLRIPGMGDTTARHFRDKLAMRMKAQEEGIRVPEFVHALNDEKIHQYLARVPPRGVLKRASEASAIGIKKAYTSEEVWALLEGSAICSPTTA